MVSIVGGENGSHKRLAMFSHHHSVMRWPTRFSLFFLFLFIFMPRFLKVLTLLFIELLRRPSQSQQPSCYYFLTGIELIGQDLNFFVFPRTIAGMLLYNLMPH